MNHAQIAAAVYQACSHFDPYLPRLSEELARAWGRVFAKSGLMVEDLIAGVDRVYETRGSGYRPLPADIVDAARALRRERSMADAPSPEYERLCESKAADADDLPAFRVSSEALVDRPDLLAALARRIGRAVPGAE